MRVMSASGAERRTGKSRADLAHRNLAPLPASEIAEFNRTERDALEARHLVPGRLQHSPDFSVLALSQFSNDVRFAFRPFEDLDRRRRERVAAIDDALDQ